jgi:pimeloyl-ACP methyl ester carboxylesterase
MRRALLIVLVLLAAMAVVPPLGLRLFGWGVDARLRPAPGKLIDIGEGLHVNVVDKGEGMPVVLVHGLPSTAYDWAALPDKLAHLGYRAIAYDRVGYGYSSRSADTPDRYTLESNARDLRALLDALGIDRAALVGWSYGGGVAQTFSLQNPQRVSHLVLLGSVGPAQPVPDGEPLAQLLASPLAVPLLTWVGSIPPLSRLVTHEEMVKAFAKPEAIPPGWEEHTRAMLSLPGTLRAFVREAQHAGYLQLRSQDLKVPTLILQGSDDQLVPPLVAGDLHQRIAGSRLVTIPAGHHMLPVTHADLLAAQLADFLGQGQ